MVLYLAWIDHGEPFGAGMWREDEDVIKFEYSHQENEFATMVVSIRNPRVGPLSDGRKIWAWFSWREGDTVYPLMLGRLVGVPSDLTADIVDYHFVARPRHWHALKEAVADNLRVLPHYDPIWYDEQRRFDPDVVLEGRSAYWYINPIDHSLDISDVLLGDDVIAFDGDEIIEGTLNKNILNTPITRVRMQAQIHWNQAVHGSLTLTEDLLRVWGTGRVLKSIAQKSIAQRWPQEGTSIGSGWTVGPSMITARWEFTTRSGSVSFSDTPPPPDEIEIQWLGTIARSKSVAVLAQGADAPPIAEDLDDSWVWSIASFGNLEYARSSFTVGNRSRDINSHSELSVGYRLYQSPVNEYNISLMISFDPARIQREALHFEIVADLQPILTEPEDDDFEDLSFTSVDVNQELADPIFSGAPMPDSRGRTYIGTPRGQRSIEHLLLVARTMIREAARCVQLRGEVTSFAKWYACTPQNNAAFSIPEIPNGAAMGKVVAQTLSFDSGLLRRGVTIACAVGRDGAVEPAAGEPSYCTEEYCGADYQHYVNAVFPLGDDIGWTPPTIAPQDDGVVFTNSGITQVHGGPIYTITPIGKMEEQQDLLDSLDAAAAQEALLSRYAQQSAAVGKTLAEQKVALIEEMNSRFEIDFRPLEGDWLTEYTIETQMLHIPRMINLEDP